LFYARKLALVAWSVFGRSDDVFFFSLGSLVLSAATWVVVEAVLSGGSGGGVGGDGDDTIAC